MKKTFAILLIALFLFNLVGYRLLFSYAQQQSDIQLHNSFDKQDYNEADLITIKVPLSLPYLSNQQNFERVDGEITVNGKLLKYVKRKIADGNLILLCLPDQTKMRFESAKNDFFRYANDLVQNNQSNKPGHSKTAIFKNLSFEYEVSQYELLNSNNFRASVYYINSQLNFLPSSHYSLPEQPPELL